MSKKAALGRGLDALLKTGSATKTPSENSVSVAEEPAAAGLLEIPMDQIDPNPDQPREHFDEEKIEELAQSIRAQGLIQPVVVRRAGDRFQLIAGERRFRACRKAGLSAIAARLMDESGEGDLEKALVENLQREDLNPMHEARAYQKLIDRFGLTQEKVAERVGRKRTTVANTLRLLRLPTAIQDDLLQGRLSEGHARAILALDNPERQLTLRDRVLREGLSVRETEKIARLKEDSKSVSTRKPSDGSTAAAADPELNDLEEKLTLHLGTRVKIRKSGKNKGAIVAPFRSIEDFERIVSAMGLDISDDV